MKISKLLSNCFLVSLTTVAIAPFVNETTNNLKTDLSKAESKATLFNPVYSNKYDGVLKTDEGFLGMNSTSDELIFTSYSGFTMWKLSLQNQHIKNMYNVWYPNLSDTDYSKLIFRNTLLLNSNGENLIVVLVNHQDIDSEIFNNGGSFDNIKTRKYGIAFAISAKTGELYDPLTIGNNNKNYRNLSVKVKDGSRALYENSAGEVIITSIVTYNDKTNFVQSENGGGFKVYGYKNSTSKIYINENGISIKNNIITKSFPSSVDYSFYGFAPGPKNKNVNILMMVQPVDNRSPNVTHHWYKTLYLVDDDLNIIENTTSLAVGNDNMPGDNNGYDYVTQIRRSYDIGKAFLQYSTTENTGDYFIDNGVVDSAFIRVSLNFDNNNKPTLKKIFEFGGTNSALSPGYRLETTTFAYNQPTNKVLYQYGGLYVYGGSTNAGLAQNAFKLMSIDLNNNNSIGRYFRHYNTNGESGYRTFNTFGYPLTIDDESLTTSDFPPIIMTDGYVGQNASDTNNGYTTLYAFPKASNVTSNAPSTQTTNQFRLNQFGYNNIQEELEKQDYWKTKLPSQISDDQLLPLLNFNGNKPTIGLNTEGDFEINITTNKDDENGVINAIWNVTYQNFYNTNKKTIQIAADLTGFNNSSNKYIKFITNTTGDTNNDQKFNEISKLKSSKYPSEITQQDVLDYFVDYNLLGKDGNKYTLTTDDIVELNADNSTGKLTIKINVTDKVIDGLANHLNTNITQEYTGFKYISGYDAYANNKQEIIESANNIGFDILDNYPNQITKQNIINHFMTLGDKFSRDVNDWDITLVPDNYNGTLKVKATYTKNSDDMPSNFDKEIVKDFTLDGLRTVEEVFTNASFSIEKAKSSNVVELFKLYETAYQNYIDSLNTINEVNARQELVATELLRSLDSNLFFNKFDFVIKRVDNGDPTNASKITLQIEIKNDAIANIDKPDENDDFKFNQTTKDYLDNKNIKYVYTVEWISIFNDQKFEWVEPDYIDQNYYVDLNQDNIEIDLNKANYKGINKNMYANQVKQEDLINLINYSYFNVDDQAVVIDNANGTIEVTFTLTSSSNNTGNIKLVNSTNLKSNDSNVIEGNQVFKTITITGFKKPISPVWLGLGISIGSVILILLIIFALYIYFLRKNLRKTVGNQHDYSKLKKQDKDVKKDYQRLSKELSKRK